MRIVDRLSGKKAPFDREASRSERAADLDQILAMLHAEVLDRLDVGALRRLDPDALLARIGGIVDQVIAQHDISLSERQHRRVVRAIADEILGLGPIESLLADPTVSDILVNTASAVYVERNGVLERTSVRFRDNQHLLNTINRIVARVGRRIDESSPMVDARLPDGSRVNATIPPLAIDGPLLCIRRFGTGPMTPRDMVQNGALTDSMLQFLRCAVRAKCNILIAGGTGAGKTTLLNALSSFVPADQRIITIEDAAELRLQQEHVARLETRPPNIEGKGEVTIRDLVRNALRMRPDRIIVGEVRSGEVLDMVQAMNTGHEGSMTTVHANNADDAITRMMTMLGMAGTQLTEPMMLQMLARAFHLVVHLSRYADGVRRVSMIAETPEFEGEAFGLQPVFAFDQTGIDNLGNVIGNFRTYGHSNLLGRFQAAGTPLHPAVLRDGR